MYTHVQPCASTVSLMVKPSSPTRKEHFTVLPTVPRAGRKVKTILPIEPFKQYVEARWYAQRSVPRHSEMGIFGMLKLDWWIGGIHI